MQRAVWVRVAPFAAFMVLLALHGVLGELARSVGVDPRWAYAVRAIAAGALLLVFWREYEELHAIGSVAARHWLNAVLVGVALFVAWINLDLPWLSFGEAPGYDPRGDDGRLDVALILLRVAGAVLVVPLMEELFWRSFLARWLQNANFLKVMPAQIGLRALFISSALFALEHHLWFAGLLAGLAFGWLYARCGSLWPPIAAHALCNALLAGYVLYTGHWQFW